MITCRLKCAALTAIILTTVLNAEAVSARRHRPEVKNPTEQRTRSESRIARGARDPVPLPRPRPTEAPPTPLPSPPSHDQACLDRLTAAGFEFQVAVLAPASNPACVVDTPVRVKATKRRQGPASDLPKSPWLRAASPNRWPIGWGKSWLRSSLLASGQISRPFISLAMNAATATMLKAGS
jgi:hypothetical protein